MATTKQTQMIAGRMVEFQDRFEKLPNDDSQWLIQNTGEAIDLFITAVINRVKSVAQGVVTILSEIIATVTIPATTDKFVAKYKFKVDTSRKAKVKISCLGYNFKNWFLKKTEEPFPGSTIYGRKLSKNLVDGSILSELGGQEKAETTLSELFIMMERQANGEAGELLTNGYTNIFYVRDITGTLRAAFVFWLGVGWHVDAHSVEDPSAWRAGIQIFSRNSSVAQTA